MSLDPADPAYVPMPADVGPGLNDPPALRVTPPEEGVGPLVAPPSPLVSPPPSPLLKADAAVIAFSGQKDSRHDPLPGAASDHAGPLSIGCGGRFLAAGLFAFTAVRLTSSR
jgi:hypothetical protein